MNTIITVDGPAGSGKSTVSRLLAKRLDYLYLDTGAMYRAVALKAKKEGINLNQGEKLRHLCRDLDLNFKSEGENTQVYLGNENISLAIRSPEMDILSSRISANKEVRMAMTELQRKIGRKGRLIAEGRDMGTVVFPDAEYKFFITASLEIRAERRYGERIGRGESVSKDGVEKDLKKRDHQDEMRTIAPLRPAEDAIIIDTTTLNQEEVIEKILRYIRGI